jgi:hypothetical protein
MKPGGSGHSLIEPQSCCYALRGDANLNRRRATGSVVTRFTEKISLQTLTKIIPRFQRRQADRDDSDYGLQDRRFSAVMIRRELKMTTLSGLAECNEKRFAEAKLARGPEFLRAATGASSMRHLLGLLAAKTGVVRQDPAATDNPANLHVIAVFFNFHRFRAPVANFERFKSHMAQLGVTLHVVELVLGQAPFEVSDACNPLHTQLRTDT